MLQSTCQSHAGFHQLLQFCTNHQRTVYERQSSDVALETTLEGQHQLDVQLALQYLQRFISPTRHLWSPLVSTSGTIAVSTH